jgi:site-specific recombinase XerD
VRTQPRLLERLRIELRSRHYSRRTELAYVQWTKRFVHFHGMRHPEHLDEEHVNQFLTHLATERKVSASTQGQALSALLFLYRRVLGRELGELQPLVRARRAHRLPLVLSAPEVEAVLARLEGDIWLMASFMYGSGLRLSECIMLRVQHVDFERRIVFVRDGKGAKDRETMLSQGLVAPLRRHLEKVKRVHEEDIAPDSGGSVYPRPSRASIPQLPPNGRGSGCFRRGGAGAIAEPASREGTTSTPRSSSAPCGTP